MAEPRQGAIGRSPRFAIAAINQSLTKLGINPDEYLLVDASGLSRQNLITPKTPREKLDKVGQSSLYLGLETLNPSVLEAKRATC